MLRKGEECGDFPRKTYKSNLYPWTSKSSRFLILCEKYSAKKIIKIRSSFSQITPSISSPTSNFKSSFDFG